MQNNSYMALLERFAQFSRQKLVTFLISASWDPWLHRSCLTSSSAACTELATYGNLFSQKPSIDKCTPNYFDNIATSLIPCWYLFKVRWETTLFTLLCCSTSTSHTGRPSLTCRGMDWHRDFALICCIHPGWTAILQTEREGKYPVRCAMKHDCIR